MNRINMNKIIISLIFYIMIPVLGLSGIFDYTGYESDIIKSAFAHGAMSYCAIGFISGFYLMFEIEYDEYYIRERFDVILELFKFSAIIVGYISILFFIAILFNWL